MEKKYSWLYKFAWGYEIAAALTGLAMATAFTMISYRTASEDGIDPVEMTDLIRGSLPFVMVAFAELCKIPLVIATVMAKTRSIAILFGATTLIAAFITFETVYIGLEISQGQQTAHIIEFNSELNDLENKIAVIDDRISVASNKNEAKVNDEITELKAKVRIDFEHRKSVVDNEITKINKKFVDKEKSVLEPLISRRDQFEKDNIKSAKNKAEEIELAKDNISTAQNSLSKYEKDLNQCRIFSSNSCKQRNRAGIADSKNKIKTHERNLNRLMKSKPDDSQRITNILEEIGEKRNALQKEKENALKPSDKKRQDVERWYKNELNKIGELASNKKENLTDNQNKISNSQNDKDTLLNDINSIKKVKAQAVNANFVYRLAGNWFDVNAGDVTDTQAAAISRIWLGSIAVIVAIMGPMIAGAYLMLNFQPKEKPKSSIRALAKAIRSQKRTPKIIEKMVEVEKLVEKEIFVEKIVEVEVEKLVVKHVPIFTNDPSLIEVSKEWKK